MFIICLYYSVIYDFDHQLLKKAGWERREENNNGYLVQPLAEANPKSPTRSTGTAFIATLFVRW